MKEANIAPFFVCMYPGLADIARRHGYALAIHGSVITDMDLVACPWSEEATGAELLMQALKAHVHALSYGELLERDNPWLTEKQREQVIAQSEGGHCPEYKPHGRVAWNLYLEHGVKIDLSVMPRLNQKAETKN